MDSKTRCCVKPAGDAGRGLCGYASMPELWKATNKVLVAAGVFMFPWKHVGDAGGRLRSCVLATISLPGKDLYFTDAVATSW